MNYADDFLRASWPPERIKAWEDYRDALENLGKKVFEHMQARALAKAQAAETFETLPLPCPQADERLKP